VPVAFAGRRKRGLHLPGDRGEATLELGGERPRRDLPTAEKLSDQVVRVAQPVQGVLQVPVLIRLHRVPDPMGQVLGRPLVDRPGSHAAIEERRELGQCYVDRDEAAVGGGVGLGELGVVDAVGGGTWARPLIKAGINRTRARATAAIAATTAQAHPRPRPPRCTGGRIAVRDAGVSSVASPTVPGGTSRTGAAFMLGRRSFAMSRPEP
jgi:hypothetical protein